MGPLYIMIGQMILRALLLASAMVVSSLIVSSRDKANVLGFMIVASCQKSGSYRFILGTQIYTIVHLIMSSVGSFYQDLFYALLVADICLVGCAGAASGAAFSMSYIGRYGDEAAGWMPICHAFQQLCKDMEIATFLIYLSLPLSFILAVLMIIKAQHVPL